MDDCGGDGSSGSGSGPGDRLLSVQVALRESFRLGMNGEARLAGDGFESGR